jgi:hypothetical protein
MEKYLKFFCLLIASFLFVNYSFAQKRKSKASPRKEIIQAVSDSDLQRDFLGEVQGSVYKNKFFGVKLVLPENWLIQEDEFNKFIKQKGSEILKGKTSQVQKSFNQSVQRVTILMTVTKDIVGIANNASLVLATEKINPPMQVRNGYDYMRLMLQSFKLLQLPPDYKYSEEIQTEKVGTENFSYINIERNGYKQGIYATYRKGYAVFFTLQFFNTEDFQKMKTILQNADFAWKQ